MREDVSPTYYDRPMLKAPHWEWNVVTYLFLGGIMGGLGVLQLLADDSDTSQRAIKRDARYASFALAAVNPAILITHLGRPERFANMLRIWKFKSPMSMGVWGLVFYSGAAGANVVGELAARGTVPRFFGFIAPSWLTFVQAALGAFMSGYTGVLLSATANPFWASGKSHIPALSVCSGVAGSCAVSNLMSVVRGDDDATHTVEPLEMLAGAAELFILADFRRKAGAYATPFFTGKRGEKLRAVTVLAGIAAPLALNLVAALVPVPKPVRALRTCIASLLTLAGGYVLRETLVEAGKASAADPRSASVAPR